MLETLLAMGARKQMFLDSGPGPQSAVGDANVAFFGEVSNTDLFTAAEIVAAIPELSTAAVLNDSYPWLKFLYYGKYLFIKKYPIFRVPDGNNGATCWNKLYAAGLIYGEDGYGDYQYAVSTLQLRFLNKSPYRFKVRTVTGNTTTTIGQTIQAQTNDTTPRRQSMFTELIYRVCADVIGSAYPEEKFASYPHTELAASLEICREYFKNGSYPNGLVLGRGNGVSSPPRIASYDTYRDPTYNMSWRPVLELVPQNGTFIPRLTQLQVLDVIRSSASGIKDSTPNDGTDPNSLSKLLNILSDGTPIDMVHGIASTFTADLVNQFPWPVNANLRMLSKDTPIVSSEITALSAVRPVNHIDNPKVISGITETFNP